jgi:hypothetical protein
VSIAFYWHCTGIGRGSHDRAGLPAVTTRNYGHSTTVVPRCPVCGLGPKTYGWEVRQQLADAGRTEVDISAMPF